MHDGRIPGEILHPAGQRIVVVSALFCRRHKHRKNYSNV
jgi:hypothetical protein